MALLEGRVLAGRYRLIHPVGQGSQAAVWVAEHLALSTHVAVKLIDPELAKRDDARERFKREATAAAHLRSAHVVQILDHGIDDNQPFIVMELLDGEDLYQRIERRGHLSLRETSKIVTQVGRALTRAHGAGIIHRDLKPENVFLVPNEDDEVVKVLDFGVAKIKDAPKDVMQKTGVGTLIGTPHYMSPEQVKGIGEVDHRADIWALGVIAYQCMTGVLPFDSEGVGDLLIKISMGEIPVPSRVLAGVPGSFDAWFARACERDPGRRFQSAKEAAVALIAAVGALPDGQGSLRPPRPEARAPMSTLLDLTMGQRQPFDPGPPAGAPAPTEPAVPRPVTVPTLPPDAFDEDEEEEEDSENYAIAAQAALQPGSARTPIPVVDRVILRLPAAEREEDEPPAPVSPARGATPAPSSQQALPPAPPSAARAAPPPPPSAAQAALPPAPPSAARAAPPPPPSAGQAALPPAPPSAARAAPPPPVGSPDAVAASASALPGPASPLPPAPSSRRGLGGSLLADLPAATAAPELLAGDAVAAAPVERPPAPPRPALEPASRPSREPAQAPRIEAAAPRATPSPGLERRSDWTAPTPAELDPWPPAYPEGAAASGAFSTPTSQHGRPTVSGLSRSGELLDDEPSEFDGGARRRKLFGVVGTGFFLFVVAITWTVVRSQFRGAPASAASDVASPPDPAPPAPAAPPPAPVEVPAAPAAAVDPGKVSHPLRAAPTASAKPTAVPGKWKSHKPSDGTVEIPEAPPD